MVVSFKYLQRVDSGGMSAMKHTVTYSPGPIVSNLQANFVWIQVIECPDLCRVPQLTGML